MRSFPSSFFGALVSERHKVNFDEDDSVFVDRNPKHFGFILEYLRNGKQVPLLVGSVDDIDELRLEAEYYGLTHLALKCRRFKLLDSHLMSTKESRSGHFAVLSGMRGASAIFDVKDLDNFEITFAGRS